MKVKHESEDGNFTAAYSSKSQGFEFIYVKNKIGKTLLFENRLAILGVWLNDFQIARMVQPIIEGQYNWRDDSEIIVNEATSNHLISIGDEILIESYKHRGIGIYDENGFLSKQTPDFVRSLPVVA